ncbi:MAG: aminotransferase class I/II-fold pyridoxal phosphate-dependent enzyme, partial [Candidatus Omnitrophota bacterium]
MLARKNVAQIKAYQPGKPIEDVKRELGLTEVIKMASNENPLGPSPKAVAAMRRALTSVNRYPDSQSFYLKRKLAAAIGVDTKNICLGNGSDELIDVVIKTFVEADENVVTADVTFLEYEIIAQVNDRRVKKVPLKNFTYDIEGLIARIDKKTKLVFIANPNNPTGTYLSKGDVRRLV